MATARRRQVSLHQTACHLFRRGPSHHMMPCRCLFEELPLCLSFALGHLPYSGLLMVSRSNHYCLFYLTYCCASLLISSLLLVLLVCIYTVYSCSCTSIAAVFLPGATNLQRNAMCQTTQTNLKRAMHTLRDLQRTQAMCTLSWTFLLTAATGSGFSTKSSRSRRESNVPNMI